MKKFQEKIIGASTRHVSAGATHLLFIIQSFKHLENFTNFPYNIRYLIYRSECILFNIKKLLRFFKHKASTTSIKEHSIKKQTIKENSRFASLNIQGNSYFLTSKIPFKPDGVLKPATIEKVFCFAYDMSFTTKGKHRSNRSGGSYSRKNGEIFANTFQGKIAECAACNYFYKFDEKVYPDFSTHNLGTWDSVDLTVLNKEIAVKSTKHFGQLLLLETKDWNAKGQYIPNIDNGVSTYDALMLIRLSPSCEDILKSHRLLFSDFIDKDKLKNIILSQRWEYDFVGYITNSDLKYIIKNDYILPKGALLNGKTPMDAENYYIQSGSLRKMDSFEEEVFCFTKNSQ